MALVSLLLPRNGPHAFVGAAFERKALGHGETISGWRWVCQCGHEAAGYYLNRDFAVQAWKIHAGIED